MNYATLDKVGKLDEVVEDRGIKVIVDASAVPFLVGTEMHFVKDALKSEFVFENPNQTSACGCGKSFSVSGK